MKVWTRKGRTCVWYAGREEVTRIRAEFHIDCYMILLWSAEGAPTPPLLVGRIRNTKIMSLVVIDVIAGDLSPGSRRVGPEYTQDPLQDKFLAQRYFMIVWVRSSRKIRTRWKLQGCYAYIFAYTVKYDAHWIIVSARSAVQKYTREEKRERERKQLFAINFYLLRTTCLCWSILRGRNKFD